MEVLSKTSYLCECKLNERDIEYVPCYDEELQCDVYQAQQKQPIVGNWQDYSISTLLRNGCTEFLKQTYSPPKNGIDEVVSLERSVQRDMNVVYDASSRNQTPSAEPIVEPPTTAPSQPTD